MVNKNGLIKLVKERGYQMAEKTTSKLDEFSFPLINIRLEENKTLLGFTNLGNAVKINLDAIPEKKYKDKGVILKSICPEAGEKEKIIKLFNTNGLPEDKNIYFLTKDGYIKKSSWSEYGVNKELYQAVVLNDGDELINVEEEIINSNILYVTKDGMCLNSLPENIPVQGRRSMGVRGINLNDGDYVIFASQADGDGEIIVVTDTGYAKRVICALIEITQRYRKGVSIIKLQGKQGDKLIFSDYVKMPYDLTVFTKDNELIKLNTEDISLESRTSTGRQLYKDKEIREILKQCESI